MTVNIADQITREEKEIQALEKERDERLERTDAEIKRLREYPFARAGAADELQMKRDSAAAFYESIIKRRRDALTVKRGELATQQKQEADRQQAEATQKEAIAKSNARRAYPGTDADFEIAWPSIWARLRENMAVEHAAKDDIPIQRVNY